MANRILRDWTFSETLANISAEAERMFVRLIMKADDFGGFHANLKILKASLFPLNDISLTEIEKSLNELNEAGLIFVFRVENKDYLEIKDFGQRLRQMNRKFPSPTESETLTTDSEKRTEKKKKLKKEVETETEVEIEKEIVVPKKKKTASERTASINYPFESQEFIEIWEIWKEYKKKEFGFNYKTIISEGMALNGLAKLYANEEQAIQCIKQSISNGWSGFFEIKNTLKNGNNTTKQTANEQLDSVKSRLDAKIDEAFDNVER